MKVYLIYFSIASPVFPILVFLIRRPFGERYLQWLFLLLIISILFDYSQIVIVDSSYSSNILNNLYFLTTFLIFSIIYYSLWQKIFNIKRNWIAILGVVIFVLFILDCFYYESIFQGQFFLIGLESIILTIYSCKFYMDLNSGIILGLEVKKLPAFWINNAVVFYFVFTLFLFVIPEYLFSANPDIKQQFWEFYKVVNVIKNGLFAIGIYYSSRKIVSISSI